jgi:hypothetical protein
MSDQSLTRNDYWLSHLNPVIRDKFGRKSESQCSCHAIIQEIRVFLRLSTLSVDIGVRNGKLSPDHRFGRFFSMTAGKSLV